ncbi:MAG: glycosyltransferase family 2 protein [Solirubrobacteraceae bacterium]
MSAAIDVVVPVHGHYELTRSCLQHLAKQTAAHHTIVVDDGSPDDSVVRLRSDWPDVRTIELHVNEGYTRAVNHGVSAGSAEYVVLLNNDVELRADCLERLVRPMEEDARIGSVAAVMLVRGGEAIDSIGVSADVTLAGFARLQGHRAIGAISPEPRLTGPEGTAGAYRRRAWEQAGGLDEHMRAYMEILDLALRLQSLGWSTAAALDALGVHLGSSTYGRRSRTQRRLAAFSRGYLLRRYGVLRSSAWARTLATETIVVGADALLCRDLEAVLGRLEGWRAAGGLTRHPFPPAAAIASSISLRESLNLRRGAVMARESP